MLVFNQEQFDALASFAYNVGSTATFNVFMDISGESWLAATEGKGLVECRKKEGTPFRNHPKSKQERGKPDESNNLFTNAGMWLSLRR